MKKWIFALFLFFSLLIPIKADGIENYRMDITVLENGNLYIMEAFEMKDIYNGFEKDIEYKNQFSNYYGNLLSLTENGEIYNGIGTSLGEIRGINFDLTTPLTELQINGDLFSKTNDAKKGDYGLYTEKKSDNGESITIYNHNKMNKDFFISYILENMVISHKDVAELEYNLFSSLKENIDHLEVTIHLPESVMKPTLFLHQTSGDITIVDNQTIIITMDNIKRDSMIDFRVLFDKTMLTTKKHTDVIASQKVFEVEEKLKDQIDPVDTEYKKLRQETYDKVEKAVQNENRDDYIIAYESVQKLSDDDQLKIELLVKLLNLDSKIERNETILKVLYTSSIGIWTLGLIGIWFYFYQKYGSNRLIKIVKEYPPMIIGYVFHGKITDQDFIAQVLYLIDKKAIRVKKINDNYQFSYVNKSFLTESDQRLLKLLFDDQKEITHQELLQRSKIDYRNFLRLYSNWLNKANYEAREEDLFENLTTFKFFAIGYSVIGVILGIFLWKQTIYIHPIFMIIVALLTILVVLFLHKKNAYGRSIYQEYRQKNLENPTFIYAISMGKIDRNHEQIELYKIFYRIIKGAYSSRNFDNNENSKKK